MRDLGLHDDAFIVVHGDQGSRISLRSAVQLNRNKLTHEDCRDLFSTLFAIKLPGGEYREPKQTVSLNVLMGRATQEISYLPRWDKHCTYCQPIQSVYDRMQLISSLIASWQANIEQTQAQSAFRAKTN